jgi:serine/threonine protein phosphatase PrpC
MSRSGAGNRPENPTMKVGTGAGAWRLAPAALVDAAGLTHPGLRHSHNEDHFLVCRFGRYLERLQTNLPEGDLPPRAEEGGYLLAVADGVGGSAAGELASRLAIGTLIQLILEKPDWVLHIADQAFMEEVMRRAVLRYSEVNAALIEQARKDQALRGYATTLTVAWNLGADLFVAHLGDSRAYLLRQGTLCRLTRDHTLAQQMADEGQIAPSELATHRFRHALLRAMGDTLGKAEPDVDRYRLEQGDFVLVCSDGLTDLVTEQAITEILLREQGVNQICRDLVDAALQASGRDNITVTIGRYGPRSAP